MDIALRFGMCAERGIRSEWRNARFKAADRTVPPDQVPSERLVKATRLLPVFARNLRPRHTAPQFPRGERSAKPNLST